MLQACNLTDSGSVNSSSNESNILSEDSDESFHPKQSRSVKKHAGLQQKKKRKKNPSWDDYLAVLVEYGASKLNYSVPKNYECEHEGNVYRLGRWLENQKKNRFKLDPVKQDALVQLQEVGLWGNEYIMEESDLTGSAAPVVTKESSSSSSSNAFGFKRLPSRLLTEDEQSPEQPKASPRKSCKASHSSGRLWNNQQTMEEEQDSDTERKAKREERRRSLPPVTSTPKMSFSFSSGRDRSNEQAYIDQQSLQCNKGNDDDEVHLSMKRGKNKFCPILKTSEDWLAESMAIQMQNAGHEDIYMPRSQPPVVRKSASSGTGEVRGRLLLGQSRSDVMARVTTGGAEAVTARDAVGKVHPNKNVSATSGQQNRFKSGASVHQLIDLTQNSSSSSAPPPTLTQGITHTTTVDLTTDWYNPVESRKSSDSSLSSVSESEQRVAAVAAAAEKERLKKERVARNINIDSPSSSKSGGSSQPSPGVSTAKARMDKQSDGNNCRSAGADSKGDNKPSHKKEKESVSFVDKLSKSDGYTAYLYTEREVEENDPLDPDTYFIGVGQFQSVTWEGRPSQLLVTMMSPDERGKNMMDASFTREVLEEDSRVMMSEESILMTDLEFYEESKEVFRMRKPSRSDIRNHPTYKELYSIS